MLSSIFDGLLDDSSSSFVLDVSAGLAGGRAWLVVFFCFFDRQLDFRFAFVGTLA
jgi:hypothetical protein